MSENEVGSHNYYVYIVASPSRTLYVGVTNDLEGRVWQHRHKTLGGFTAKNDVTRLVWFEWHTMIEDAIAREKQVKGWSRAKKLALIEAENPKWWDLSRDWELWRGQSSVEPSTGFAGGCLTAFDMTIWWRSDRTESFRRRSK